MDGLFEDVRRMKGAANYCLPSIAVGASALDNAAPASPQPDASGGAGATVTAEPAIGTSRPSDRTWSRTWVTFGHMDTWPKMRAELVPRSVEDLCLSIIDDA
jgi:hypothetical protein